MEDDYRRPLELTSSLQMSTTPCLPLRAAGPLFCIFLSLFLIALHSPGAAGHDGSFLIHVCMMVGERTGRGGSPDCKRHNASSIAKSRTFGAATSTGSAA